MSGPPVYAGSPSEKRPATALAVGCGLLVALGLLAAVALGSVLGWWLYRDDPPRPEESLRDGTETSYLTCRLRADDPAVRELVGRVVEGLVEIQARGAPVISRPDADEILSVFPLELEIARYREVEADLPVPAVFRIRFESGFRAPRAAFRLAAAAAGSEGPLRRADAAGVRVLVAGQADARPIAIAFVGDRLVGSNRTDLLHGVLSQAGRPARASAQAEVESLLGQTAIDGGVGWGYALAATDGEPGASGSAVRLAVYSFRLGEGGRIAWRAALRGTPTPDAGREATAQAWAGALTGGFPETLVSRIEGEPRWLDERTVVVSGSAEGLGGLLDGAFRRVAAALPDSASPPR